MFLAVVSRFGGQTCTVAALQVYAYADLKHAINFSEHSCHVVVH